jgi:ABC-2 type transport system permease protein
MMKLWATIQKDVRLLLRDKVGLLLMFAMPILLVIIVTAIQNSTFDIMGGKRLSLLVCNKDEGNTSKQFIAALDSSGLFNITFNNNINEQQLADKIYGDNVAGAVIITKGFSKQIEDGAKQTAGKALHSFGLEDDAVVTVAGNKNFLRFYYNPALQQSLKLSIRGAVTGSLQMIESKATLKALYYAINESDLPDSLQQQILKSNVGIEEIPLAHNMASTELTATQHNVPAWTIFAMFFVVMSFGSSIVREKLSGSFIRLKTLPTSYFIALLSKQVTYLGVTVMQAITIFAIGIFIFPFIGLPALHLPHDIVGLIIVTLVCGWCAVSYAMCIGVFAQTQEQASAFGAVSVVILSIIGGLMIPSFILPGSFRLLMSISPLHWCLQAYYVLFLEGGRLKDAGTNILSLLIITLILQAIALLELKRKKLI